MKSRINEVSSFMYYMWNSFSREECDKTFPWDSQHMWDKWVRVEGNIEKFYADLDDMNRMALTDRACAMYDGNKRRKILLYAWQEMREAENYAERLKDESLAYCVDSLEKWVERYPGSEMRVRNDSSPYSFSWALMRGKDVIINGGLLYHGTPDESMAVTFDTKNKWQIHT